MPTAIDMDGFTGSGDTACFRMHQNAGGNGAWKITTGADVHVRFIDACAGR